MTNIRSFPEKLEHLRNKSQLSDYLRVIADYIDGNFLEVAPEAITLILTGDRCHEVLKTEGYSDYPGLFHDAVCAARVYANGGDNCVERRCFKNRECSNDKPAIRQDKS